MSAIYVKTILTCAYLVLLNFKILLSLSLWQYKTNEYSRLKNLSA